MKNLKIILILAIFCSCAENKKNPLLIPPDYDKIVKEEKSDKNNSDNQNNEEIIELKKLLLKN